MMAAAAPQDDKTTKKGKARATSVTTTRATRTITTGAAHEDRSYQRYQTEHHQKHSFAQLSTGQQTAYWNWRHNNLDSK